MLDAIYLGRIIDRGIYQERQQAAHSHFLRSSANRPTGGEPNVHYLRIQHSIDDVASVTDWATPTTAMMAAVA